MTRPKELYSAPQSGSFLSENFDRNPVISTADDPYEKILYDRNGTVIRKRSVELDDKTRYHLTYSTLDKPVHPGLEGIASYEATAWLTRGEGVYVSRLKHLADMGIAGTVISSPQNFGKLFSVTENGRNQHEIIKWQAAHLGRDGQHMIGNGISEAGMIEQAVIDQAEEFDQFVLYADSIVPCFADGLDLRAAADFILKAPNEIRSIKSIAKSSLRALYYLPRTADITKEGTYVHLQTVLGLLNGDVGRHYDNRPTSTFGHMTQFDGDFLAQGRRWQRRNERFPHESFHLEEGGCHIDCVGRGCHDNWNGRHETVSTVLQENPHIRTRVPKERLHAELYRLCSEQNSIFTKNAPSSTIQAA